MSLIASPRSVNITARRRRCSEWPSRTKRRSPIECLGSSTILPRESPNTVLASSDETPCFARLLVAFSGSGAFAGAIVPQRLRRQEHPTAAEHEAALALGRSRTEALHGPGTGPQRLWTTAIPSVLLHKARRFFLGAVDVRIERGSASSERGNRRSALGSSSPTISRSSPRGGMAAQRRGAAPPRRAVIPPFRAIIPPFVCGFPRPERPFPRSER